MRTTLFGLLLTFVVAGCNRTEIANPPKLGADKLQGKVGTDTQLKKQDRDDHDAKAATDAQPKKTDRDDAPKQTGEPKALPGLTAEKSWSANS